MIKGVEVIEIPLFKDNRGILFKSYTKSLFEEKLDFMVAESWFTISQKNTIRGMHMQLGEFPSRKIVTLISGTIVDVLLDCRKGSETYGNTLELELNTRNATNKIIVIPIGVAHGYKVLENNSVVQYFADQYHHSNSDIGYHYDSFGYLWDIKNPIISQRDLELSKFNK